MQPPRRLAARARAMDPYRFDPVLGCVGVVAIVLEAALINHQSGGSRLATAVFGALMVGPPLALRRRNTLLAAAILVGAAFLQLGFDTFALSDGTTTFIVVLLLLYSAGRHLVGRRLWAALFLLIPVMTLAISVDDDFQATDDLFWVAVLFVPPVLAGRALRNRALLQRELREKAELAEAGRETRARAAAEEERNRIAAELQAVVANSLSAMVVQAEAVPRVLAAGNPPAARDAFGVIEETGRDALAEMRRLLGVLRREGEDAALAPQPGLARLDALLERVRESGLEVERRVEGERRELAPGIDLTAYRVLQEALDAAVAGQASAAAVTLRFRERDLELEVRDRGASEPGAGFPVAALRERVGLYGGYIRASRSDGFAVEVRLPLARAAAPAGSAA